MYCALELALSQSVVERTTNTHLDRRRLDPGLCYVAPLLEHSIAAVPVNTAHVIYPGISQNTSGYAPRLSSFIFLLDTIQGSSLEGNDIDVILPYHVSYPGRFQSADSSHWVADSRRNCGGIHCSQWSPNDKHVNKHYF